MTTSFDPAIRALAEMVVECIAEDILKELAEGNKPEQCANNNSRVCGPTSQHLNVSYAAKSSVEFANAE
jgi:hypothetical protein